MYTLNSKVFVVVACALVMAIVILATVFLSFDAASLAADMSLK
jgi:hypothetical protein